MSNNVHPDVLAQMDYEQQFMQAQQKGSRRVKMERGKMWLIRFLPANLGPNGTWFARVARHWLSMKPILCPRYTSPDFGGDPDADCPCCEVAAALNDSPDPEISKFGFTVQGNAQWLTFCAVFEKDGAQQSMREVLAPYEFNHYKSTFEELMAFYKAGIRRSPQSVLDYKTGNDFVVTKTGKGFKLDKQDAGPIFDLKDPNFQAWVEKIEAGIKMPKITMPTNDQLHTFSLKIQDWSDKLQTGQAPEGGGGGRRRPRTASGDVEDDGGDNAEAGFQEHDDEPARPAARRPAPAAAPAARRPAPAAEEVEAPGEDDSNPELAPQRPAAAAPATRRPAPAAAAEAAPARRPAPAAEPVEAEAEEAPAAPVRRPAPAAAPQRLAPSPNRAREATTSQPEEEAEEEALPEEAVDSAPPAEAAVSETAESEPPAVTRRGAGIGSQIKNKISDMSKRGA